MPSSISAALCKLKIRGASLCCTTRKFINLRRKEEKNFLEMSVAFENTNPKIYEKSENRLLTADEENESVYDEIDCREIFDLLRNVADPEYPLTLEELKVVDQSLITVDNKENEVRVQFTPTVPHCSMATLIGLSLRVQLLRSLPPRFKVLVHITPGTHASEHAVNKQLNDKERVAAALENSHLAEVINHCIGKSLNNRI